MAETSVLTTACSLKTGMINATFKAFDVGLLIPFKAVFHGNPMGIP